MFVDFITLAMVFAIWFKMNNNDNNKGTSV